MRSLQERFDEKWTGEPNSGCWLWTASLDGKGYGEIGVGARGEGKISAHRASYELHIAPIPKHDSYHGICVLHKCDTPICVNPDHLFLGTQKENVWDMLDKGRVKPACGSKNSNSKLIESDVMEIKKLLASGVLQKTIASRFHINGSQVSRIKNGKTWGHVA